MEVFNVDDTAEAYLYPWYRRGYVHRTQNTETHVHVHKITKVPVFYMALGLNDFDVGKSITRAITSHAINNRYINSYNPFRAGCGGLSQP